MTVSATVAVTLVLSTPTLDSDLPDWARGARALAQNSAAERPEISADPGAALIAIGRVYPDPELATKDVPKLYDDGCQVETSDMEPVTCDYGDTASNRVVAVVGDSKVGQWLPALDVVGVQEGWLIRTYTKSRCSWTDAILSVEGQPYDACTEWGQRVLADLTGPDKPIMVVTSSGSEAATGAASGSGSDALVEGYVSYWRQLQVNGVEVIALADNPAPAKGKQVYTCVGDNPQDYAVCSFPASQGRGTPSLRTASERLPGVQFVDPSPWLCLDQVCPPVIGNVLVYRQGKPHHRCLRGDHGCGPTLRTGLRAPGGSGLHRSLTLPPASSHGRPRLRSAPRAWRPAHRVPVHGSAYASGCVGPQRSLHVGAHRTGPTEQHDPVRAQLRQGCLGVTR